MSIQGYPSSYRAPFSAIELTFGQGPSNAPNGPRTAFYCGPKTASGTAVVNTRYPISRESDAVTLFGAGSPLHRMIRRALLTNKLGGIVAMCYAASVGSGVATATGTITITMTSGPNPTATGLLTTYVCGVLLTTSFSTSSTVSTIAADLADQINGQSFLPVVATAVAGVVTLTAKIAGASQGDGTTGVIRFRSNPEPGKNVVATPSGLALGTGTGVAGSDGATTELANLTAALNTITNTRFYYMGFSVWSTTAIAPIKTHISNKSEANPGLRSRAFTAYTGTLSALQAIAIACNHERRHFVHQENSEWDTADLVGNAVAVHQKAEAARGTFLHDIYRDADWMCPAAYDQNDWPTSNEINDSCTDGIIQVASDQIGSFMVMSVNSRSKDSTGAVDDFRATETHRVSFMDDLCDTILLRDAQKYGTGFKQMPDQKKPDGSLKVNQRVPPRTLTPSLYKPFAAQILEEYTNDGVLQGLDEWLATLNTFIDPNNVSRMQCSAAGRTIDIRHQTAWQLSETTPG